MYIDCESVYSSSSAVKQTSETLQKKFGTFVLSLLASFIVVITVSKSVTLSWGKQISVNRSDLLAINKANKQQRLRF